jgi:hypothetical protein
MTRFLILHGTGGTPKSNWFMWLKGVLIGKGYEVWLPQLPNAAKPNRKTYNDFILANKDFVFDKDTVIIGHSSGAVEVLNLLQHLPEGSVVKAAIMVAIFKDDLEWEALKEFFIEPFDFNAIKKHCPKFTYVHSDNDPYCPIDHPKYFIEQTGGELIIIEGQGHFNLEASPEYKQFPQLLEIIDKVL